MRRAITSIAFSLFVICFCFAMTGEIIPFGSDFYNDIDTLFVLNGQTIPSASRPWTMAEARNELSKIDSSSLSGYSLALYEKLSEYVTDDRQAVVGVNLDFSPEIYAHTNESFDTDDYWVYNYERRRQFAILSINASAGGYSAHTELNFGLGRATANDRMENFDHNLDSFPVDMTTRKYVVSSDAYSPYFRFNFPMSGEAEVTTPTVAWITYAWKNGSVGFYKSKKEWGKTSIGNYIYDSHISAYNYISAKFFNRIFNFDYTVMIPSSYLGGSAKAYQIEYQCLFLSHRLQVQILKNLSLALSENVMYWLKDGFEPIFVNPAVFFHSNVQDNLFNALAHVELEFVPIKGLRVYSQLGVDQGSMPFFESSSEEDLAAGLTIGAEYLFALNGAIAGVNLEGAIVTPSMYRRGGQYPDFIIADVSTVNGSTDYYTLPFVTAMGFPYGGDTLALKAGFDYRKDALRCSLSSMLKWKGEQTIIDPKTTTTGLELTGDVVLDASVSATAEYNLVLLKRFPTKLSATLSGVYDHDRGFDVLFSVGVSSSFNFSLFY
ncbi:MAG: hypothetical protein ILP16_03130 [Spirochaetales bacterium]|nr:hypothetical protein [Spirochaetales bacterium]